MLRNFIKTTWNYSHNNLKHCAQLRCYATELEMDAPKTSLGRNEILRKYTEDEKKILNIINNYNLNELLRYKISKARANKLLAWRMRNGPLSSLNDIFLVEGFGLKVADSFYQSLLQDPKTNDLGLEKRSRVKTASFITPSMEAEQQSNVKSCVSLRIGVNSITWSKLELGPAESSQPCQLTHWQHHEISEKKLHLSDLIQRCLYVTHLIPSSDCYIFENPQMAQISNNPGSVEQQNISIQKSQVTAIMGYALASRTIQKEEVKQYKEESEGEGDEKKQQQQRPLVFYVRRFLTARLFNHLVGTERVSSEETILNMMRTYYNLNEMQDVIAEEEEDVERQEYGQRAAETRLSFRGNVQFPMDLRHMFSKSPRYHREFLSQALLLNLAFVRLVLLQDSESIAQLTTNGKTKN